MTSAECKEVFALLSDYLNGELPQDVCEEIDRHIGDCPPCIEFLESMRKTTELCRVLRARQTPGSPPASALEELRAAYRKFKTASDRGH